MSTKQDLIRILVQKLDYLSLQDAEYIVDATLEYIKDRVTDGNRLEIRGFGSMSLKKRKYCQQNKFYNVIYYRMSDALHHDI